LHSFRNPFIGFILACCAAAQTPSNITTFAGTGTAGATGDTGVATAALLNNPIGVAVDSVGNVYIADSANSKVRMVNTSGVITTFAGTGVSGSTGDGGLAISATLTLPTGVAVDSQNNVYIADAAANRVRKVSNGIITTFAGSATGGFGGDGGAATVASLNYPASVAVDAAGNIYVADTGNHRIRKVAPGGIISTVAGNGNLGYTGDGVAATTSSLFFPQGVAVDNAGNIYIADTRNDRIRQVSAGIITTFAGTGTAGYSGDKGAPAAATINVPRGVAVDSFGNLYIADTGNNAIRRISNNVITTVAGNTLQGYSGDGGSALIAELNAPGGVGLDSTGGFLYIGDTNNNAVRLITNSVASGVLPQFAAGGSYVTGLYVINKSASPSQFTISFYNDQGAAVTVPLTGGTSSATTSGNSLTDTIPGLGTGYYEAGVLGSSTTLSGSAIIQSTPSIVVQGLFRHQGAPVTPYEAAISSTLGSFEAEFPFDSTTYTPTGAQITTGIAIVNLDGSNSAAVTCVARDNNGTIIPSAITVPVLNPQGHWAAYQFSALVGKRGTLDCTSTTKIGVTALRFLGTDAVSTLPVILK
jgi:sugar lactone lactonase YvrE